MSHDAPKPVEQVKLNVETILQTSEGRPYLRQINSVSQVLSMKNSEVVFRGEEIVKTGYVGDCKSVHLFKCPNGYFVFCNKAFTSNNWSAAGASLDEVLALVYDDEIKTQLRESVSASADAA